jgi:hypothetical protein
MATTIASDVRSYYAPKSRDWSGRKLRAKYDPHVAQLPRNWAELQAGTFHASGSHIDVREGPLSRAVLWLNAQREAGINPWGAGGELEGTTGFGEGSRGLQLLEGAVDSEFGTGGTWLGEKTGPTQAEVEQARSARGGRGTAILSGRNIGDVNARSGGQPAASGAARSVSQAPQMLSASTSVSRAPQMLSASTPSKASGRAGVAKRRRGAAVRQQSLGAPRGKQLLGV